MGILSWDGEDIGIITVVLSETLLQIFKLRKYKQVITSPVKKQSLDFGVPLMGR